MTDICSLIDAARGNIKSDLVIKNIKIINVFSQEIEMGDIAIHKGKIVGIGEYDGEEEINGTGMYASPGLIDSHVHVESSMTTPPYFTRELFKKGITTVIADPHEIANVMGSEGIKFMINQLEQCVIDIYYMLPSCVPATPFEDSGALLMANDLREFRSHKNILGLGEVMDVPSVLSCKEDMIKKLKDFEEYIIDGHAPLLSGQDLNAYVVAGVKTDHECSNVEEALEKIKRGVYILIREGSAAKNLEELIPAVTALNFDRFLFCTDDKHADDIILEGSIDNLVRKAIALGLDPVMALTIASLNAAKAYNLNSVGAIAPGYKADLLLFNDINKLNVEYVIKNGSIGHIKDQKVNSFINMKKTNIYNNSMNIESISTEQLNVKAEGSTVNVIDVTQGSLITKHLTCSFKEKNGFVEKVYSPDVLKIAIFERHKRTCNYFVGYIKGLGIKNCAIAQTIAHDSHNIVVVGEKEEDMAIAVNTLIKVGGGIVITEEGNVVGTLELPIGGLMKESPVEEVAAELKLLRTILKKFNNKEDNDIFLTLSFMSLPVIPYIKITSRGLFNYNKFEFMNLFNE